MPTIKLQWWLGNQMFQYALGYALSKQYDEPIILDPFYLENRFFAANWTFRNFELEVFGIKKTYAITNSISRTFLHPRLIEMLRSWQFKGNYIREVWGQYVHHFPKNAYIDGWFNSYQYFESCRDDIYAIFQVKTSISSENQKVLDVIQKAWSRAVSLHVRRGDYVTLASANKWHGVCSLGYYEASIEQMKEKLWDPVFFIFSDDIDWCKANIHFPEWIESHYIDHNGSAGHEDMRLMYSCAHHVIANSSFSWWGAYLWVNLERVVIAPKKWIQENDHSTDNLLPPSWTLL